MIDGRLSIYPREEFDRAWMASIYPDHGLGGKNGEITDAIFEDSLEVARDLGHTLLHSSLNDIVENVNAPVNSRMVFNDLTWKRDRQVEVEISKDQALVKDDNGRIIPSQIRSDGDKHYVTFVAQDVPPMGYRSYEIKEGKKFKSENDEILISNNSFENLYYRAVLGNGGIVSLYDKILGKDVIHTSKFACGDVLELGYTGNGAGEFTRITDLTSGDITPLSSFDSQWRVVETGALYTRFENIQPTKHATIVQTITFLHTKKQIDFDIELRDFDGEHNRQYRIAFPINMSIIRRIHIQGRYRILYLLMEMVSGLRCLLA